MKTFVIINGKEIFLINEDTMEQARERAIKVSDHSLEIIVREVEGIKGFIPIESEVQNG